MFQWIFLILVVVSVTLVSVKKKKSTCIFACKKVLKQRYNFLILII